MAGMTSSATKAEPDGMLFSIAVALDEKHYKFLMAEETLKSTFDTIVLAQTSGKFVTNIFVEELKKKNQKTHFISYM